MKKIKCAAAGLLLLIGSFVGLILWQNHLSRQQAQAAYASLRESVVLPSERPVIAATETAAAAAKKEKGADYEPPQSLVSLMKENPYVIGWLKIADTNVDYPLMQNREDNEYFLHRDINGAESLPGSIYMDSNHEINQEGLHVIYGHHMRDGSMFKDVSRYTDPQYFKNHGEITVYSKDREICLEPVYCYAAEADGDYRGRYTGQELTDFLKSRTGQEITGNIYTLITCSYGGEDERTYLICKEKNPHK